MKNRRLITLIAGCLAAVGAQAQKAKTPSEVPGDLFFTRKGQPFAMERVVPGIQGALLLTDEQKLKLNDALQLTIRNDAVRSAGRLLKEGPDATEVQLNAARKVIESARARLAEMVSKALTQDQKNLIAGINRVCEDALAAARTTLDLEFTAAKGDKFRTEELNRQHQEAARSEMDRLLGGILSADHRDGMERAAQRQRELEQSAAKKGK